MLAGLGTTLVYIFVYKGWFFFKSTAMLPDNVDNWLFGINPQAFGFVGACINFAVSYVVSNMTDEPPEKIQRLVEDIRVPIGSKDAVEH